MNVGACFFCSWVRGAGWSGVAVASVSPIEHLAASLVAALFGGDGVESQLWAQLLNAAVVLVIGGAVIKMFFSFKDTATQQAERDRETTRVGLQAVEDKVNTLSHALMGVAGYGGLIEATKIDAIRRHELANQVMRTHERIHSLAEQVERIASRVGVPFDKELLEDVK